MAIYFKTVENVILHLHQMYGDNFKIYSLTEILHHKEEKKFCEILNPLHKAQCTEEDNRIFESYIVKKDSEDYNFGARHVFPFANAVKQHNRNIFHQMQEDKVTIQAEDAECGNPNEGQWNMAYYHLMIRDEYDKINGLLKFRCCSWCCLHCILQFVNC